MDFPTPFPAHLPEDDIEPSTWRGFNVIPIEQSLDREIELAFKRVAWIVGGDVSEYLSEHGDRVVETPPSFSALESRSWKPYVGRVSGPLMTWGYGISRQMAEGVLRLLTGRGHFDETDVTIVGCGVDPFIATGPRGTLIASVSTTGKGKVAHRNTRELTVDGQQVETIEGHHAVLEGVKRVLRLQHEIFGEPIEFTSRGPLGFHFRTESGRNGVVEFEDLRTIGLSQPSADSVLRDGNSVIVPSKSWEGDVQTLNWAPEHQVGEEDEYGHTTVGFRLEWRSAPGHIPGDALPGVVTLRVSHNRNGPTADRLALRERMEGWSWD